MRYTLLLARVMAVTNSPSKIEGAGGSMTTRIATVLNRAINEIYLAPGTGYGGIEPTQEIGSAQRLGLD